MNSGMLEFENNVKIETLGKKRRTQQIVQSSYRLACKQVIQTKLSKLSLEDKYFAARRKQWQPYIHMGTPTADRSDARIVPEERTDSSMGLVFLT